MPSIRSAFMSCFRSFCAAISLLAMLPLSVQAAPAAEWTVMVYMCGDNNLEMAAIMDMLEMEQSIPQGAEVLVLLDRSKDMPRSSATCQARACTACAGPSPSTWPLPRP